MMAVHVAIALTVAVAFGACCVHGHGQSETDNGCTAKFLLPQRPFMVVWNHPSAGCEAHGIDLNLSAWDIVENRNDSWTGDNMVIFYGLGHWPIYHAKTNKTVNGGVPQRGNLEYHLTKVQSQVMAMKSNFTGVAVIDFESWRPLFEQNFDSLSGYQALSEKIVRARYPYLNKTEVQKEAAREFDIGARLFFESTLQLTNKLTPGGHWGFYGFPRDWGGKGGQLANDKVSYIWTLSRGLFPRIYMDDTGKYLPVENYIRSTINETLRVWAKYSPPDTLILPYSLCNNGGKSFFSKENLTLAIGLPGDMGAAGVVLWGSSGDFHTPGECQLLQRYINTTLGPYVKNLTQFLTNCSNQLCSGHGRCLKKEYEAVSQMFLRESGRDTCRLSEDLWSPYHLGGRKGGQKVRREDSQLPFDDYVCRCLKGWTGDHCDKSLSDL